MKVQEFVCAYFPISYINKNNVIVIASVCGAGSNIRGQNTIRKWIGLFMFRRWLGGGICKSTARLDGKTVVITGGNTGIGKVTALELAKRGAHVVIACRDTTKGEMAVQEIKRVVPNGNIVTFSLDLSSLQSVHTFATKLLRSEPRIHILINNAGVACCPQWKTEDGFEMQLGVNHLGHFLLTLLLLDCLKKSAPARIINVSSVAHRLGKIHFEDIHLENCFNPFTAYYQSKLANVLFTNELAKRLQGSGVTAYALHPGAVQTELGRYLSTSVNCYVGWMFYVFGFLFFKSAEQGAQTTIYCAVTEELENQTGLYYNHLDTSQQCPQEIVR
ncbi:retinol dehydrogenase 11-like isoform X3 [Tachypleus tridentatus]|uniref:retinol dehydrogenase 11-like isoform X3 n=1 Tax=Tachypleus tridentatus TaxID=6853 RepID=UPI003FD5BF3E